jgi:hypothetical protein
VPARYEIRIISDHLDETTAAAFAGLNVTTCGNLTVISGELDQAGLHGLLQRIRIIGLDLVEARRVRGSPAGLKHGWITLPIRKEASMTERTYEIKVTGSLGPAAREAFTDVSVEVEPTATVLCADLSQAGLHALLDRVRAFGLELVSIGRVPDHLDA